MNGRERFLSFGWWRSSDFLSGFRSSNFFRFASISADRGDTGSADNVRSRRRLLERWLVLDDVAAEGDANDM